MLDRQHGKIVFECDVCGDLLETDTRDFNEARGILDAEGWHARNIDTVWQHGCTECGDPGRKPTFARNARVNGG